MSKGEGVELTDHNGRVYLDMMSSHTRANSLGYGTQEIAKAVYDQLAGLHYVGTVRQLRRAGRAACGQARRAGAGPARYR